MFSKRHYEAIAEVVRNAYSLTWDGSDTDGVALMEEGLADLFANDNPRFDIDKFTAACNRV